MFAWQDHDDTASRYVTDRHDGASLGAWSELNLGAHVGDDAGAVTANRAALARAVGRPLVAMDQVHGAEVAVITQVPDQAPRCDAMVTTSTDLALMVLVADCVPVLLTSPQGVVGVAHAGRAGMMSGVVTAAIDAMRDLGAERIDAVVGPSICERCYEVPADLADAAGEIEPVSRSVTWTGTPAIGVATGVVAQLRAAGAEVHWLPGCTLEDSRWYSYRRDGQTGRFAGIVARARA